MNANPAARPAAGRRTDAVLLLVAVVWGSSYLAAKTATGALPVPLVLFARYAVSAGACLALVAARGGGGRGRAGAGGGTGGGWARGGRGWPARIRFTRDELRAGLLLGVTQASVLVLETYGVAHTTAANAGLIISLTIVLTPMLDRAGHPGGLPPAFHAAAGTCVLAVGLLMAGTGLHAPRLGDLLVLAAAAVRAGHVALVGRCAARRPLRPPHLTTVQTAVGTLLFLGPAAGQLPRLARAGAVTWAELAYLALLCSVFAFLAQTWAVQHSSASRASLLLGTEPVWAVAAGVALGGERLTALAALGAALMVAATYRAQSVERRHRAGGPAVSRRARAAAAPGPARPRAAPRG